MSLSLLLDVNFWLVSLLVNVFFMYCGYRLRTSCCTTSRHVVCFVYRLRTSCCTTSRHVLRVPPQGIVLHDIASRSLCTASGHRAAQHTLPNVSINTVYHQISAVPLLRYVLCRDASFSDVLCPCTDCPVRCHATIQPMTLMSSGVLSLVLSCDSL